MKVSMVSYKSNSFKGNLSKTSEREVLPFLYNSNPKSDEYDFKHKGRLFIGTVAFLAATAVCTTLINLSGKKKFPLSIVDDVGEKVFGLNKFGSKYKKTSEVLKAKVLYPLKLELLNDKKFKIGKNIRIGNDIKLGIIIKGNDKDKLRNYVNAFMEHVKKLGINYKDINYTKELRSKDNDIKTVYKMIKEAEEYYKTHNKFTVINLDDLQNITNFEGTKTTNSNIDKKLIDIINFKESKTPKGIVWIGCKLEEKRTIPDFYSKQPSVLITELAN